MNRSYEPLVGFDLWISRIDSNGILEETRLALVESMVLPKSKKKYIVTLKNVKVFIRELHEMDPSITKIQIIRLSYSGVYKFSRCNKDIVINSY